MRKSSNLQESFAFMRAPRGGKVNPPFSPPEVFELAARGIFLGTSSWKYRGWEGLIYRGGYESEAHFQRQSLPEYADVLPCVGVDFTYHSWPMDDMIANLLESTPENFKLCPKVTQRITLSSFPNVPSSGRLAGQKNPDFLNAETFSEKFLKPLKLLAGRIGLIQFEFSGTEELENSRLEEFFSCISREFSYSIEIRNPSLVRPEFYRLMRKLQISPAFNSWYRMPSIGEQWRFYLEVGGGEDGTPILGLGILRPDRTYEQALQLFHPYRERKEEYPDGLSQLAELIHESLGAGRKAFILVNNSWEGSAPHSLGQILERFRNYHKQ